MKFKVTMTNYYSAIGLEVEQTMTLKQVKAGIRALKARGYHKPKGYHARAIDVEMRGGLLLVKNTCSDYDAYALYLKAI